MRAFLFSVAAALTLVSAKKTFSVPEVDIPIDVEKLESAVDAAKAETSNRDRAFNDWNVKEYLDGHGNFVKFEFEHRRITQSIPSQQFHRNSEEWYHHNLPKQWMDEHDYTVIKSVAEFEEYRKKQTLAIGWIGTSATVSSSVPYAIALGNFATTARQRGIDISKTGTFVIDADALYFSGEYEEMIAAGPHFAGGSAVGFVTIMGGEVVKDTPSPKQRLFPRFFNFLVRPVIFPGTAAKIESAVQKRAGVHSSTVVGFFDEANGVEFDRFKLNAASFSNHRLAPVFIALEGEEAAAFAKQNDMESPGIVVINQFTKNGNKATHKYEDGFDGATISEFLKRTMMPFVLDMNNRNDLETVDALQPDIRIAVFSASPFDEADETVIMIKDTIAPVSGRVKMTWFDNRALNQRYSGTMSLFGAAGGAPKAGELPKITAMVQQADRALGENPKKSIIRHAFTPAADAKNVADIQVALKEWVRKLAYGLLNESPVTLNQETVPEFEEVSELIGTVKSCNASSVRSQVEDWDGDALLVAWDSISTSENQDAFFDGVLASMVEQIQDQNAKTRLGIFSIDRAYNDLPELLDVGEIGLKVFLFPRYSKHMPIPYAAYAASSHTGGGLWEWLQEHRDEKENHIIVQKADTERDDRYSKLGLSEKKDKSKIVLSEEGCPKKCYGRFQRLCWNLAHCCVWSDDKRWFIKETCKSRGCDGAFLQECSCFSPKSPCAVTPDGQKLNPDAPKPSAFILEKQANPGVMYSLFSPKKAGDETEVKGLTKKSLQEIVENINRPNCFTGFKHGSKLIIEKNEQDCVSNGGIWVDFDESFDAEALLDNVAGRQPNCEAPDKFIEGGVRNYGALSRWHCERHSGGKWIGSDDASSAKPAKLIQDPNIRSSKKKRSPNQTRKDKEAAGYAKIAAGEANCYTSGATHEVYMAASEEECTAKGHLFVGAANPDASHDEL